MDLGVPELLIIAFIVVLLFGSKKLPAAARSIGQSLKIFKDETKGGREHENAAPPPTEQHTVQNALPSAATAAASNPQPAATAPQAPQQGAPGA
ncbi:MAG TPA: twin-arginine translocase TatA/TatE family subunit [Mycobacteriales bacterium]|jgi:sec-independent protein translocase protein TatA|nr:twin-arginine translocase TatA/TatE family subunit [Mycobacteriales bacterium]